MGKPEGKALEEVGFMLVMEKGRFGLLEGSSSGRAMETNEND